MTQPVALTNDQHYRSLGATHGKDFPLSAIPVDPPSALGYLKIYNPGSWGTVLS